MKYWSYPSFSDKSNQGVIGFKDVPERKSRKKKSAQEYHLQVICVKWFDLAYPEYKLKFFHIPNQSIVNNARAGKFLKDMGRRAGVFDCFLAVKTGPISGMFIDFKANNGDLSDAQTLFMKEMKEEMYACHVVESMDQFISIIQGYLGESKLIRSISK